MLNTSRLLSKISIDPHCAASMVKKEHLQVIVDLMEQYAEIPTILIRVAFVLGNLTTHYEDVRYELSGDMGALEKTLRIALHYLDKDECMDQV